MAKRDIAFVEQKIKKMTAKGIVDAENMQIETVSYGIADLQKMFEKFNRDNVQISIKVVTDDVNEQTLD